MTESHEIPAVVTKREAADLLRVSLRTIDRMISDGQLKVTRPSIRATRIYESSIADLIHRGSERDREAVAS